MYNLDRQDLKDDVWAPMTQPRLATSTDEPVDLFAVLRERDVLVHHPYDSFSTSVEAFIEQVRPFGILEMVRTGRIAMLRDAAFTVDGPVGERSAVGAEESPESSESA